MPPCTAAAASLVALVAARIERAAAASVVPVLAAVDAAENAAATPITLAPTLRVWLSVLANRAPQCTGLSSCGDIVGRAFFLSPTCVVFCFQCELGMHGKDQQAQCALLCIFKGKVLFNSALVWLFGGPAFFCSVWRLVFVLCGVFVGVFFGLSAGSSLNLCLAFFFFFALFSVVSVVVS